MNPSKKEARAALRDQLVERMCNAPACDVQAAMEVTDKRNGAHLAWFCRPHAVAYKRLQQEHAALAVPAHHQEQP